MGAGASRGGVARIKAFVSSASSDDLTLRTLTVEKSKHMEALTTSVRPAQPHWLWTLAVPAFHIEDTV